MRQASHKKNQDPSSAEELIFEGPSLSFFDINQFELAFINRAIKDDGSRKKKPKFPKFINIGKTKRILSIQKGNLESLLRQLGREHREEHLDGELSEILSGNRLLSIMCFGPSSDV